MKKCVKVAMWAMGVAFFGAALASWLVYDAENGVDDAGDGADDADDGVRGDDLEKKGGEK